jgi:type IV pilus assembly protein PilA
MRTPQSLKKSEYGFSLVELMMVVAIIGVLSAIAVPQYGKVMRIVRTNQAKAHLSSLYAMEKAFYAEYMSYTARLDAIGFQLEGKVYFNVGFQADYAPPAGSPQGTPTCTFVCNGIIHTQCSAPANEWLCMNSASYGLDGTVIPAVTATGFMAGAHAHLGQVGGTGAATEAVSLSIDDSKVIIDYANPN